MPFKRPDANRRDDEQLHRPGADQHAAGQHDENEMSSHFLEDDQVPEERQQAESYRHHGKDIGDEIDLWL